MSFSPGSQPNLEEGRLRDKLEKALLAELPDLWVNGDRANRPPNTTNIGFRGVDARTLIRDMHDISVSTRSACFSGAAGPSHVLKAIGLTDDEAIPASSSAWVGSLPSKKLNTRSTRL